MDKKTIYLNTNRNKEVHSFFFALLISCFLLILARNDLTKTIVLLIGSILYLYVTFYLLIKKTRQFFYVREISVMPDGIMSFRIEVFSLYCITKRFRKNELIIDKRRMRFKLALVSDIISFDSTDGKFMFWIPFDKDTFDSLIKAVEG